MTRTPTISIVIAASDSPEAVARTLATIPDGVECIVAAPAHWPRSTRRAIWLAAAPPAGVPRLRRLGVDRSSGDVIVLTEDSCLFTSQWLDGWLRAFRDPTLLAASGPVAAAMGDRAIDLAVFLCEYAPFAATTCPDRPPGRLAGNNFAMRRELAARLVGDRIEEADVERMAGTARGWAPRATALHVRNYGLAEAIRDRLRFGHGYGRNRMAGRAWPWRGVGAGAGPLILASQGLRLLGHLRRRGFDRGRVRDVLPLTLGLLTAWSVGEWLGWAGSAFARPASRR